MKSVHLKILIGAFLLCIFSALYILLRPNFAKADAFQLYASDCSGGFDNVENASGSPSVKGIQISGFNETNSAVLEPNKNGEIKCTGFSGEIIPDVAPKKVSLKFSWAATYSKAEIVDETKEVTPENVINTENITSSSTEVIATTTLDNTSSSGLEIKAKDEPAEIQKEETPKVIPPAEVPLQKEAIPEVVPPPVAPPQVEVPPVSEQPEPSPVSIYRLFGNIAFAEESTTTPIVETNTTTSDPIISNEISEPIQLVQETTSSTSTIVTPSVDPYGIVGVEYSLDGNEWNALGNVEMDKFSEASFEIPLVSPIEISTLNNISIRIKRLPSTDGVSPYIYLDSLWLDVEYDKEPTDPHPEPSLERGDIFESSVSYDTYTAFVVDRPSNDIDVLSNEDASSTSSTTIKYKSELWVKNEISSSSISWVYIAGEGQVSKKSKVFFEDGSIFWIDNSHILNIYNPSASSNGSMTLNDNSDSHYMYSNSAGGKRVMIIKQPDDMVTFEDYLEDTNKQ